ncbi:MAG: hypothetical protein C0433_10625 [Cyclobacterium sp.]|nr:hypothetical protein [Cyclobacterium sp.]
MMEALLVIILGLAVFFLLNLVIGLYRPVLVLWFLDRFNRLKVIQIYGALITLCLIIWLGLKVLFF